jgi:uncharacterized protein YigE (DUF2233 family)
MTMITINTMTTAKRIFSSEHNGKQFAHLKSLEYEFLQARQKQALTRCS